MVSFPRLKDFACWLIHPSQYDTLILDMTLYYSVLIFFTRRQDYTLNTDIYNHLNFIFTCLDKFLKLRRQKLPLSNIQNLTTKLIQAIIEDGMSYSEIEEAMVELL